MTHRIILPLIIFLTIISCSDKQKESELLEKISKLEKQLDECENGAEKLHARMKLSFEKEEFDECKSIFGEMEKRHPNSELFTEVNNIYQQILLIENKREEERKRKAEKEKQEKLKALNKLKKNHDDVSGITWYKQPYFTHYTNVFRTSIYMGQQGARVWLRLMMSYAGDDWIFFENAYLSFEGNTKQIFFNEYSEKESDNGYGGVWEWIDVTVSDDLEDFLRSFAKSPKAKMRFSGKYTKTRNLTRNEKQGILDVLNGYDVLKGSFN